MGKLIFGTAGIPLSTKRRNSIEGIKRLVELGLGAMEVEFVRRVSMQEETARKVGAFAKEQGIVLTVHAPYYINFNSKEPEKVAASRERLILAATRGHQLGARGIVFHPGFRHDDPDRVVYDNVKENLIRVREELDAAGIDTILRMETTGGVSQFGTFEETLEVCSEIPGVEPCIDFSHLHARTGALNSAEEFVAMLDRIQQVGGREALDNMHIHLSGIEYGDKGERKHLILEESDMEYKALLQALWDFDVGGVLICESPNIEGDALLLAQTWEAIAQNQG